MVEGGGLENHCGGDSTGGSNPSPSATTRIKADADTMTASDLEERNEAFEKLERGEALDLHEAMRQW